MPAHPPASSADKQILDFQVRIREQKARLQHMIAQGTIAQSDDDLLRDMYATLKQMQAARLRKAG